MSYRHPKPALCTLSRADDGRRNRLDLENRVIKFHHRPEKDHVDEKGTPLKNGTDGELELKIYYDQRHTFEADVAEGNTLSKEPVVNCGNVYIFVTESGDLELQDGTIDHI